jgi:hypothetical protein
MLAEIVVSAQAKPVLRKTARCLLAEIRLKRSGSSNTLHEQLSHGQPITKAEGDREAAANLAVAAKTMAESPGAMQLRTLQTIDGLGPGASNTVILAVPIEVMDAIDTFGRAHHRSNGHVPEPVLSP